MTEIRSKIADRNEDGSVGIAEVTCYTELKHPPILMFLASEVRRSEVRYRCRPP